MEFVTRHHLELLFLFVLNSIPSSKQEVVLVQTIPANDALVCPGGVYQYTCTSTANSIAWHFDSMVRLLNSMTSTSQLDSFYLELIVDNGTHFISTATDERISSALQGEILQCLGGNNTTEVTIDIADGPANCSNTSISCEVRPSTEDGLTEIEFQLFSNDELMCVDAYQFLFNGETKDAPTNASSAVFNISNTPGQAVPVMLEVYTLDYEGRKGQIPCTFIIIDISEVDNVSVDSKCDMSALLIEVVWMPSQIGGCLNESEDNLRYILEFSGSPAELIELQSPIVVENTTYTFELPDLLQDIDLEVTIIPNLSELGLNGSAMLTHVHVAQTNCEAIMSSSVSFPASAPTLTQAFIPTLIQTSSPTSTPASTSESDAGNLAVVIGIPLAVLIVIAILTAIAIVIAVRYFRSKPGPPSTPSELSMKEISDTEESAAGSSSSREIETDTGGDPVPSGPSNEPDEEHSENHSPIQSGYFESSRVAKLAEILKKASRKWKTIGTHLGLDDSDLPQENDASVKKSFMDMLAYLLRNPPEYPYKRRILFEAVMSMNPALGKKLKKEYDNEKELDIGSLSDLLKDLHELESHWEELGRKLGILEDRLDTFCPLEDCKGKFVRVLRTWMDHKADDATLTKLYDALMAAEEKKLACDIIKNQDVIGLLALPD